jgi:hypothetical protein
MSSTPNTIALEALQDVAARLNAAPYKGRGAIVQSAAQVLGVSVQTVYSRLKAAGLYDAGRKRRTDAGTTMVAEEVALKVAGLIKLGTRANGKKTMSVKQAARILAANGVGVADQDTGEIKAVSATTLARAMREHNCHPQQLAAGHTATAMRSLHPNHVWQVDSSIGTLFYAPNRGIGGIQWLDETEVYKNKPNAIERVSKDLCIRWLITDHASDAFFVRYQAGTENALGFIEFFIEAIQQRGAEPFHGVPFILVMDPGAAARAKVAVNLLERLGVRVIIHATKNSRAKGGVEGGHNRWEQAFESRLALWYPPTMEALNARADLVRRAYCAQQVHTRHRMTRYAAWLKIRQDQLRIAPPLELCRELVTGGEDTRTTDQYGHISYAMAGFGSMEYDLSDVPGIAARMKVRLVVNPYRAPAIDVLMAGDDGNDIAYTVAPMETDAFGFAASGAVWGEEYKAKPMTPAERQLQKIHQAAYDVPTQREADAARKARQSAYGGAIDPFADAAAVQVPSYMPRRGTDHPVAVQARERAPVPLVQAVKRLKAAGDATPDLYAAMQAQYGAEVPADALDARLAEIQTTPTAARAANA